MSLKKASFIVRRAIVGKRTSQYVNDSTEVDRPKLILPSSAVGQMGSPKMLEVTVTWDSEREDKEPDWMPECECVWVHNPEGGVVRLSHMKCPSRPHPREYTLDGG